MSDVRFETAMQQWREGERRLAGASPGDRMAMERVVDRIVGDLRRRLGSTFTVDELVDVYEQGTSWTLEIAVAAAPEVPAAWEQRTVADAAFQRYVRDAVDFAGGRRLSSG